jgi:hypothetical protein
MGGGMNDVIAAARGLLVYRRRSQYWGKENSKLQGDLQKLDEAVTAHLAREKDAARG